MKMKDIPQREKRGHERVTLSCDIEFSSRRQIYQGKTSNLSLSGLFIVTKNTFPPGTIINMVIHLPDGSISKLIGKVTRASSGSNDKVAEFSADGMGVAILTKDTNYLRLLVSMTTGPYSELNK